LSSDANGPARVASGRHGTASVSTEYRDRRKRNEQVRAPQESGAWDGAAQAQRVVVGSGARLRSQPSGRPLHAITALQEILARNLTAKCGSAQSRSAQKSKVVSCIAKRPLSVSMSRAPRLAPACPSGVMTQSTTPRTARASRGWKMLERRGYPLYARCRVDSLQSGTSDRPTPYHGRSRSELVSGRIRQSRPPTEID